METQRVVEALAALRELDVSDWEAPVVLNYLLWRGSESEGPVDGSAGTRTGAASNRVGSDPSSDDLSMAAQHLQVGEDRLDEAVYLDGGEFQVLLPPTQLGSTRAERQRSVALLAVGVLEIQHGGWLPIQDLRAAMQDAGEYDRNMADNMRRSTDYLRLRGTGSNIHIRLTGPGRVAASQLVEAGGRPDV